MINGLIAAVVGAAVAAGVAMWIVRNPPAPTNDGNPADSTDRRLVTLESRIAGLKKNPPAATILLQKDDDGNCVAQVDSDPIGHRNEGSVLWYVLNDDCELRENFPRIELEFIVAEGGQYPFKDKKVTSRRANELVYIHQKIKKGGTDKDKEVQIGTYPYKIFLLNGAERLELLDPVLEVEPPPQPFPGPAAAPPPPPPQKKP